MECLLIIAKTKKNNAEDENKAKMMTEQQGRTKNNHKSVQKQEF